MSQKVEPITPDFVLKQKEPHPLPDEVVEAFNDIILRNYEYDDDSVQVGVDEVIERMVEMGVKRKGIDPEKWHDSVEHTFRSVGWKEVEFLRPNIGTVGYYWFKIK